MIRIIQGPPALNFQTDVSAELVRVRVTWRDPQSKKSDKAVTAGPTHADPAVTEAWLQRAVARLAEHVEKLSATRTIVEC